jgi:hypothetical protein
VRALVPGLSACRRPQRRHELGSWALAIYAALASHQYGAFVLAVQVVYVVALRLRGKILLARGAVALAAVVAVAIPLWRSNLVLASRLDLGVGSGGEQLGGPLPILEYLRSALGDFVAG